MPETRWKQLPEFPLYEVGDSGVIRRIETGRPLGVRENQHGVAYVRLVGQDQLQKGRSLALLVAQAFLPRPEGSFYEAFDTPITLDNDRYNCAVDNLAWRPLWFAREYNRQFSGRYHSHIPKPIYEETTGLEWGNSLSCAAANGLLEKDVVLSILNRTFAWPTFQLFKVF